ncbi:hypothetical protein E2C01_006413 [Portunus trituberculatus]|uniref:Uncharacterized protein n=1 Tax=Portunus trituberculatus TaxID=210409 RepID=A0A5B7CW88_PORTR|nr:hypothetical protein [Portunus trituberculatus]
MKAVFFFKLESSRAVLSSGRSFATARFCVRSAAFLLSRSSVSWMFYKQGFCKYGFSGKDCKFNCPKPYQRFSKHGPRDKWATSYKHCQMSPSPSLHGFL